MTETIYHGDPTREHHFWVYPPYKLLQNSQWDAYNPYDLCDNFTLIDPYHCTDTKMYKCNGHPVQPQSDAKCSCFDFDKDITIINKFYHGDPSREHQFWVYPQYKLLQNSQWDAYNPNDICDDFTLIDPNHCGDTSTYRCNGHPIECDGDTECCCCCSQENVTTTTTTDKVYHGDPSREHFFWVYPRNQPLINPQYEAYDPTHLCNNFSIVTVNPLNNLRIYKCNGHSKASNSTVEYSHWDFDENVTTPHKMYHGDADREHHFWIYPRNKQLINPQWDAYDPTHLCDNFTLLDTDHYNHLQTYKCNGH